MSVVLLVRHAQASFGLGTYDRLSEQGRAQATHLGQVLAERGIRVDRIVSGALDRQRETAELLSGPLGGPPRSIDPAWDEYDHMPLITRVRPAYRKQWMMVADLARTGNPGGRLQEILDQALEEWVADPAASSLSGAARLPADDSEEPKPFATYAGRIARALDEISGVAGTTLVVSSAGTIAAAIAPIIGVSPTDWPALHRVMVNSSVTKVVRGQRGLSLISFNEHGHLEGVPNVKITYR